MPDSGDENAEALRAQVDALNDEIAHLRAPYPAPEGCFGFFLENAV